MKLLRDFRLRFAGVRASGGRAAVLPRDFNITVPAPLAGLASEPPAPVPFPHARAAGRREPASFLRSSRHLRRSSGRG